MFLYYRSIRAGNSRGRKHHIKVSTYDHCCGLKKKKSDLLVSTNGRFGEDGDRVYWRMEKTEKVSPMKYPRFANTCHLTFALLAGANPSNKSTTLTLQHVRTQATKEQDSVFQLSLPRFRTKVLLSVTVLQSRSAAWVLLVNFAKARSKEGKP
jgi:hypothetical protein